ncbi:hypothetical protein BT69DRAFT_1351001 [Atractiella rhizophila]|nr:hypothetical protein BT69DRAFT_1351001 [Atractiella rhizophila]
MDPSESRRQFEEERLRRFHRLGALTGYPTDRNHDLWFKAITHSSYSGGPQGANGGLARLGDAAMKTAQIVVIHRLGLGDDGKLTCQTTQRCLSGPPLENACKKYGLQDFAYHNLQTFGEAFCVDLVKAIIGAVYLDSVSRGWSPMERIELVMHRLGLLDYNPQLQMQPQQATRTMQASRTQ